MRRRAPNSWDGAPDRCSACARACQRALRGDLEVDRRPGVNRRRLDARARPQVVLGVLRRELPARVHADRGRDEASSVRSCSCRLRTVARRAEPALPDDVGRPAAAAHGGLDRVGRALVARVDARSLRRASAPTPCRGSRGRGSARVRPCSSKGWPRGTRHGRRPPRRRPRGPRTPEPRPVRCGPRRPRSRGRSSPPARCGRARRQPVR